MLQVATARVLACLLLVMVRSRLLVQPVVKLLQDLECLVNNLFCIDEIDNVGLIRCVLETASLDLISLVLAVLRKLCILISKLLLQASLCVFNCISKLDDLTFKRFLVGGLVVQLSMVVFAFRVAPSLLFIVGLFLLGDQFH